VLLARSLHLLCGSSETTPEKLFTKLPLLAPNSTAIHVMDSLNRIYNKYMEEYLPYVWLPLGPLFNLQLFNRVISRLTKDQQVNKKILDFWNVFASTSKCANARDCIYSILAIIRRGAELEVDYREDAIDLCWRAGQLFIAWEANYRIKALKSAMELDEDVADTVRQEPRRRDLRCTIHLHVQAGGAK
jgi:hypothetical protein